MLESLLRIEQTGLPTHHRNERNVRSAAATRSGEALGLTSANSMS